MFPNSIRLNFLPNNSFFELTLFEAFVDHKLNVAKIIISVFDPVENIVEKGEMLVMLWEKGKILDISISSLPHNVCKSLLS